MKEEKKCCMARNCPCYPNCDQMMADDWKMPESSGQMILDRLNMEATELMELAELDEEDLEKLKELYPLRVRQILAEVEKVCDSMEYEGSVMFDELPEKQRILELREGIREKMEPQIENWEQELQRQQEEDIYVMDRHPVPPQMRPPHPPCPPVLPPGKSDWFGDLIQVLLQEEMYHRRCRHRNCRKW